MWSVQKVTTSSFLLSYVVYDVKVDGFVSHDLIYFWENWKRGAYSIIFHVIDSKEDKVNNLDDVILKWGYDFFFSQTC